MVPAENTLGVLSRKFHIRPAGSALGVQGVAVFQGRDYTNKYVESMKNRYNAVDESWNDAISFSMPV